MNNLELLRQISLQFGYLRASQIIWAEAREVLGPPTEEEADCYAALILREERLSRLNERVLQRLYRS